MSRTASLLENPFGSRCMEDLVIHTDDSWPTILQLGSHADLFSYRDHASLILPSDSSSPCPGSVLAKFTDSPSHILFDPVLSGSWNSSHKPKSGHCLIASGIVT